MNIFVKIKSLKIQGAKQIAIESLLFLKRFAKKKGFEKEFYAVCRKLENTRPTAVVLHNCLEIIKKEKSMESINRVVLGLIKADEKIALYWRIIRPNSTIMTHCHSGEVLALIKAAYRNGRKIKIFATETEPKMQGVKTAAELAKTGLSVTLIIDSAAAYFMHKTSAIIVGCDAIRKEGIVNKIGTELMAISAKEHKVPFYVVGSSLKIDRRKSITVEQRPLNELRIVPAGVKAENPAFDITPWKFVTAVITDKGIFRTTDIKKVINHEA